MPCKTRVEEVNRMRLKVKITYSGDSEDMLNNFLADFKLEDIYTITQHGDQVIVFYKVP